MKKKSSVGLILFFQFAVLATSSLASAIVNSPEGAEGDHGAPTSSSCSSDELSLLTGEALLTRQVQCLSQQVQTLQGQVTSLQQQSAPLPVISGLTWGATKQGQVGALGMGYYIASEGVFPSRDGGVIQGVYVGQIMLFAGGFAPGGWLPCDGRLLSISGNEVLFTLIGPTFGGDGVSTFALPDLRDRVPMGMASY